MADDSNYTRDNQNRETLDDLEKVKLNDLLLTFVGQQNINFTNLAQNTFSPTSSNAVYRQAAYIKAEVTALVKQLILTEKKGANAEKGTVVPLMPLAGYDPNLVKLALENRISNSISEKKGAKDLNDFELLAALTISFVNAANPDKLGKELKSLISLPMSATKTSKQFSNSNTAVAHSKQALSDIVDLLRNKKLKPNAKANIIAACKHYNPKLFMADVILFPHARLDVQGAIIS